MVKVYTRYRKAPVIPQRHLRHGMAAFYQRKYGLRNRKRGGNGKASDMVIYKGIGMPDRFLTKLKYSENITLASSGVGTEYKIYQYRGNGLYDTNYTGTGQQPEYFDQLCAASALYTQYLVYASKIVLRCCSTSDSFSSGNVDIAITPSQTLFANTGWAALDDQLASKMTKRVAVVRYDNSGAKFVKHYAKTDKILDIKDTDDNLAQCAGTNAANPTSCWNWIIGQQGMDRTSTTASVNYNIQITYYVRFFNLTDRPLS